MPTYIQTIKEQGVFLTSGTVTILSGASLSDSIYLGNRHLTSIITSTAWTAASISFQFSLDNITFYNAYSLTAALTETASSTLTVAIQIAIATTDTFHCARYLKLRSGTSASPVNQAADRVLTVISMID
jgi:hypothetical protein